MVIQCIARSEKVVIGSAGNSVCAVYDRSRGESVSSSTRALRVVSATGMTPARYIINSCVWLVNTESDW